MSERYTGDAVDALLRENAEMAARLGVLLSFACPADVQAAAAHIARYGLLDAEGNRLDAAEDDGLRRGRSVARQLGWRGHGFVL